MDKDGMGEAKGQRPQSAIRGVGLASFLQLMQLEQKTCTLCLSSKGNQGRIFMARGEVINAQIGSPASPTGSGHEAFRRIMAWDLPAIDLTEGVEKVTREIRLPLMHLLMESQQQIDESNSPQPPDISGSPEAGSLNAQRLGALLATADGVTGYEVSGPEGEVCRETHGGLDIAPALLLTMGDNLGTLLNSRFKYLKINLDDKSSYWAGRIKGLDVRVKLKPGFRPGKLMD